MSKKSKVNIESSSCCPACGRPGKLVLVRGDDWAGLYKDGKLFTEGHSVDVEELAVSAGIDLEVLWPDDFFDGYERSRCPDNLSEVRDFISGGQ